MAKFKEYSYPLKKEHMDSIMMLTSQFPQTLDELGLYRRYESDRTILLPDPELSPKLDMDGKEATLDAVLIELEHSLLGKMPPSPMEATLATSTSGQEEVSLLDKYFTFSLDHKGSPENPPLPESIMYVEGRDQKFRYSWDKGTPSKGNTSGKQKDPPRYLKVHQQVTPLCVRNTVTNRSP